MRRYKDGEPRYPVPDGAHVLVCVDLGKRKVGLSVWHCGLEGPVHASTVCCDAGPRAMAARIMDEAVCFYFPGVPVIWVCEWPVKRPTQRIKHEDIQALWDVADALEKYEGVVWAEKYRPGEWKGNVTKGAHHRRLRAALEEDERLLCPGFAEHDAWDAIGIGLFALARTGRGGVV